MSDSISWVLTVVCIWLAIHHGRAYKSIPTTFSAFMCALAVLFTGVNLFTALT